MPNNTTTDTWEERLANIGEVILLNQPTGVTRLKDCMVYDDIQKLVSEQISLAEKRGSERVIEAIPDNMINGYEAPGTNITTVKDRFRKLFLTNN